MTYKQVRGPTRSIHRLYGSNRDCVHVDIVYCVKCHRPYSTALSRLCEDCHGKVS